MDKENFMYSCNCFFYVCLLSHFKKENFQQLCSRVEAFIDKKFSSIEKLCSCSNCRHNFNYKIQNIWILREVNCEYNYNSMYVVCKNYLSYILRDIFICQYEEKKMNTICLKRNIFSQHIGKFACCYNYFRSGLLNSDFFCVNCKVFLCSLHDFKLNKIDIIQ